MVTMTNKSLKEAAYEIGHDRVLLEDESDDSVILAVVEYVNGRWPENFSLDRHLCGEIVKEYERGWRNSKYVEVGTKLKNGAMVIAVKGGGRDTYVLLAVWHKGTKVEYMTWQMNAGEEDEPYWGHYFETIEAAVEDYTGRQALPR